MSSIQHKKNRIIRSRGNSKVVSTMIFHWCITNQINRNEFMELLNAGRIAISSTGKKPYTGNEDPELIMA